MQNRSIKENKLFVRERQKIKSIRATAYIKPQNYVYYQKLWENYLFL